SGTLGSSWTSQGSVSISGGQLRLDTNGSVRSLTSYGTGIAVDWAMRMPSFSFRFWSGFQVDGTFADFAPWIIWIARGPNTEIWPEYQDTTTGMFAGVHQALDTSASHLYGVDRLTDRVVYRYDDEVAQQFTMPPVTDPLDARITNESAQPLFSTLMRIRKTVHPYPMVSLGPLETHP